MTKSFTAKGSRIKYGESELYMESTSSLLSPAGRALCKAVEHEDKIKMTKVYEESIKEMRRGEMVMDNKQSRVGSIVEVTSLEEPMFGNNMGVVVRWNGEENLQSIRGWEFKWDDKNCYWLLT